MDTVAVHQAKETLDSAFPILFLSYKRAVWFLVCHTLKEAQVRLCCFPRVRRLNDTSHTSISLRTQSPLRYLSCLTVDLTRRA